MSRELPDEDTRFEQWLLEAERREAPPRELTERAWARFAGTSAQLSAAAAGGAALNRLGPGAWLSKLAWLGAGAALGSAVTLSVVPRERAQSRGEQIPAAVSSRVVGELDELQARALQAPGASAAATPGEHEAPPTARHEPPDTRQKPPTARREPSPAPAPRRGSAALPARALAADGATLAAEVRALDAVRRAIDAGEPGRALAAVAAFHADFPRAQLAADAEGLAIEALLAQADHAGAARRARRFLQAYPEDPHVPRFEPVAAER